MIKNIILPLALLATAQAAMAQADPERLGSLPEQELDDVQLDSIFRHYELEEVVVTGTRTPKFLKDTPIQTRVITSRDIARTDATNVQDLLQQELPGVEFSYSMNQKTHLNFAGFGGQGILFLVDGERLAGESMDDVDFSRLLMAGVERIEIVKGASSALYGSSAAGGVVNIITKNATEPWTLNLNARYAKHNDQRYGGVFGLSSKHWRNAFSANYHNKDNYNVTSAANPVTRVISTIYGERTVDFKDKLTWRPSDRLSIGARAGYFFRETTRTVNLPERYRDFSGGLRLDWLITKDDNLQASYAFDQYDKSDYQQLRHLDIRDYSNVQNRSDCSTITRLARQRCSPSVPTICTTISLTLISPAQHASRTATTCSRSTTGISPTNSKPWLPCATTISPISRTRSLRQSSTSAISPTTASCCVQVTAWASAHRR